MNDESRIAAWDAKVDRPLTGLAIAFLGLYAWQVLDTRLGAGPHEALDAALTAIWAMFGLDYLVRIRLARRRWYFVGTHLLDLLILLLPMFRPLRALRVVTVISVLNRQLRDDARGRVAAYVGITVTLIGFVAALAVLEAERNAPGASITTFGEALWWTITTLSTVGYGDRYPVTVEGRLVAATLLVAGIALLGVVTASIATWFVENLRRAERDVSAEVEEVSEDVEEVSEDVEATRVQLAEVLAELRTISARLDALERSGGPTSRTGRDRSVPSARPSASGPPARSGPAPR
jgi:voltage-gated potassium channel